VWWCCIGADFECKDEFRRGRKNRVSSVIIRPYRYERVVKMPVLRDYFWVICHGRGRKGRYGFPSSGGGFTLLEIIITMVILCIAGAMIIPMMSSASSTQIRSASNIVAADLEYAKSMAITRGQDFSVVFDAATESYQIQDEDGVIIPHPVKKGFDYEVNFSNDSRLNKVGVDNVNFNSTSTVTFDYLGTPDSGGDITLEADGVIVTITVEPVTGFVTISD
jgi:prepilin-type N-terminal cleavage/methylation domain-containing protein